MRTDFLGYVRNITLYYKFEFKMDEVWQRNYNDIDDAKTKLGASGSSHTGRAEPRLSRPRLPTIASNR
jgi:hypothetical protein